MEVLHVPVGQIAKLPVLGWVGFLDGCNQPGKVTPDSIVHEYHAIFSESKGRIRRNLRGIVLTLLNRQDWRSSVSRKARSCHILPVERMYRSLVLLRESISATSSNTNSASRRGCRSWIHFGFEMNRVAGEPLTIRVEGSSRVALVAVRRNAWSHQQSATNLQLTLNMCLLLQSDCRATNKMSRLYLHQDRPATRPLTFVFVARSPFLAPDSRPTTLPFPIAPPLFAPPLTCNRILFTTEAPELGAAPDSLTHASAPSRAAPMDPAI